MLQYFYTHSPRRCGRKAVEVVAARGHLDILEFIFAHQMHEDMRTVAINAATRHGQLEILMTLVERYKSELELPTVIDHAAAGGHLEIVWYLHEVHFKDGGGCTSQAMRDAAVYGHLNVVKFLFETRTEGCAPNALSLAAQKGHLEIVRLLREKYAFACSTAAMEIVARNRHVETLAFLYESGAGRCLDWTIARAAMRGNLEVVQFLHAQRSVTVRTTRYVLESGVESGSLGHGALRYLFNIATEDGDIAAFVLAVRHGRLPVVTFLLKHLPDEYVLHALRSAAVACDLEAVKALHCELKAGQSAYSSLASMVTKIYYSPMFDNRPVVQYFVENQECEPMKSFLKQAVVKGAVIVANAILNRSGSAIAMNELVEALELAVELSRQEIGDLITVKIAARED